MAWFAALSLVIAPTSARAHPGERMVILTLPTGYYITGAALVVALTALIVALGPRLPNPPPRCLFERRELVATALTSCLACVLLAALIAIGLLGSRDPLGNLLPLTIWTLLWVGFTLACMLLGNLWPAINPWTGPARLVRRALGFKQAIGLARLGCLPAILGYFGFAWFQLISPSPDDPAVLARAVLTYWLLVFALAVLEGEDWLESGEALTVFFGFIARIAPLWIEPAGSRLRQMIALPGAQILIMPPLTPGAVAFLALVLASVTFDGLGETFWWLARIGVNPLEFPGRSAVVGVNTLGLIATWALTAAAILGAVVLGRRMARARAPFWPEAGSVMLAFLPIAAGYHLTHYLVSLLGNGQYAVLALTDPFGRAWNLFGLPEHWVSFGFLSDRGIVLAIWNLQVAVIVGAHLLAVILGAALVRRQEPEPRPTALIPLTALMVAYTVLGLWLLSTPTAV